MTLRVIACAALLAAAAPPLPAFAADQPAAAPSSRHAGDPEYATRRICRVTGQLGTRLGNTRVCKTRAEWDAFARDQRNSVEGFQRFTPGCAMGSNAPGQGNMPIVCGSEGF